MLDFDIDKMCRVCLQTNLELYLLFDENNAVDGVFISHMISEMTIYTIHRHDDFPHQICFECMDRVRSAYKFKKLFEQSHRKLLAYLDSIDKKTIHIKTDVSNDKCIQTDDSTLYPCEKCDDKFVSYHRLREHRQVSHRGTANLCRFCFKTFNRIGDLKNHIAVHHQEISHFNPHECLICNRKFTRKEHVNRHMAKIHKIGNFSEDEKKMLNEIKSDAEELEILVENEIDYRNLTKQDKSTELSNIDLKDYDYDDGSIGAAENPFSSDEDDKPLAGLRSSLATKNKELENITIKLDIEESSTVHLSNVPKLENIKSDQSEKQLPVDPIRETISSKFKCTNCDKSFKRSSHLKRHFLSHVEEKPYSCESCDKRFSRADHLKSHMSKHNETKEFQCEGCDRSFNRADLLKRHKIKNHNADGQLELLKSEYCEFCNKSFCSKQYLQKHIRLHTNKSWKCNLCPIGFETKEALKEHNKSHEREKPFLCSECGLRFVRNDYLLIHMRRHTGEKPYKCKYCDKGFPRATDLNVHVKYHTGERTHLCTICGKGFQRSYNLKVHMRVHTGERPYQCSHCDKRFAQCNDLKAHMRRHTGERFKCELCGIGFIQAYNLTQHKIDVHGIASEARNGRVSKVKQNSTILEDASEAVDNTQQNIKVEDTTYYVFETLPLTENQSLAQQEPYVVELNFNDI